jgi:hypothetical protein
VTPAELRAIRHRAETWDLHAVCGDRIRLLEEVDRLTAELATAREAGWDDCAEHVRDGAINGVDRPYTHLLATNPHRKATR